jgi:predicted RNA-binding Zn-ribbon protein involved in translation (DUF1610 family)
MDGFWCPRCGADSIATYRAALKHCQPADSTESLEKRRHGGNARKNKMRKKRIAAGMCADCGLPRDGKSKRRCNSCNRKAEGKEKPIAV